VFITVETKIFGDELVDEEVVIGGASDVLNAMLVIIDMITNSEHMSPQLGANFVKRSVTLEGRQHGCRGHQPRVRPVMRSMVV
jgi:hypothetical protein